MNYEQISKMTFAELRALEYDLNRVKCERSYIKVNATPEEEQEYNQRQEEQREYQLTMNAEWDNQRQVDMEAQLSKKAFLKTYKQRVEAFDITIISKLPEMVGVHILGFIGIEKTHEQNHRIMGSPSRYGEDKKLYDVMELARRRAFDRHHIKCHRNFEKMKLTKIKAFFAPNAPLYQYKHRFKLNSKDNFLDALYKWWVIGANSSKMELLTLLIASTR